MTDRKTWGTIWLMIGFVLLGLSIWIPYEVVGRCWPVLLIVLATDIIYCRK